MAWLSGRGRWGAASAGLTALLCFSAFPAQVPVGIADTKHNLGSGTGPAGRNQTTDTAEICVFCHTPHGGSTTAPVPLWNKRLGAAGTPAGGGAYTTYDTLQTPSLDGTVAAGGLISMACLSCHDGTQAMDNVINAPGSGGVLADGGGNDGQAFTWTGGTVDTPAGRLTSGAALIGTDLSNDHPIGIQYCGGGLTGSGTTVSGTCKDSDFNPAADRTSSTATRCSGSTPAATASSAPTCRCTSAATGGLGPLVECASCHDPHVSKGQAGPARHGPCRGRDLPAHLQRTAPCAPPAT
jgi:hypothetical protein